MHRPICGNEQGFFKVRLLYQIIVKELWHYHYHYSLRNYPEKRSSPLQISYNLLIGFVVYVKIYEDTGCK